jgi:uncharacterized membrane protein YgaE (UPF0421/DUF939 family)
MSREHLRKSVEHACATAFVSCVCYATGKMIHLVEVYWAVISAVVVLQGHFKDTEKASWDRFVGTAIGALTGWFAAAYWHGNIWIVGLAIFVGIAICELLNMSLAGRLCGVTIAVIALIPRPGLPAHEIAFHRFIEVSYGIIIALIYTLIADAIEKRVDRRRERRLGNA